MKKYTRLIVLAYLALFVLSCSFLDNVTDLIRSGLERFSGSPAPEVALKTPTLDVATPDESLLLPDETPKPQEIILFDEFNDDTNNWEVGEFEGAFIDITGGQMVMDVITDNIWGYSIMLDNIYESVNLVVDVEVITPAEDGNFGLICGFQDEGNFAALEIKSEGYYTIWAFDQNRYKILVDWTYSEVIGISGTYSIGAYCGPDRLDLSVDDVPLVSIIPPNYHAGKVGLIAGTYFYYPFKVGFDNFTVLHP